MSKLLPDLSKTGNLAVIRQCCSLWRDFLCFMYFVLFFAFALGFMKGSTL